MGKFVDLSGQRFGKLVALERAPNIGRMTAWKCRCDCGNETIKKAVHLVGGKSHHCGCDDPHKPRDEVGNRYGHLTVIKYERPSKSGRTYWLCRCDCGNEVVKDINGLRRGKTKSCGCLKKELAEKSKTNRRMSRTQLYSTWINMKNRCTPGRGESSKYYGDRGIKVCEEWLHDFPAFASWAYANGYDENAVYGDCTIDRIDPNGDYEPSNCRWANARTQHNNTRRNRYIECDGKKLTATEWQEISGIPARTITRRIDSGWTPKDAIWRHTMNKGNRKRRNENESI